MNRLVIIIDALRYDAGKQIIAPYFNGTCMQALSLSDWTFPAFFEIGKLMRNFCGNITLVSGGGWVSRINWKKFGVEYKIAKSLFPLKNTRIAIKQYKDPEGDSLLVVHDYWVHQWFMDMPNRKVQSWKCEQPRALDAYNNRCRQILPWIQDLVDAFDWDIYITSDHSELMWEVENSYHHNYLARGNPMIREIPLISLGDAPILSYSQLFTVSDMSDLAIPRPVQLKIRYGSNKFDSIKYINDNIHM